MAEPLTPETVARALGRLNDYLSTLPVSAGRSQALVDVNILLTATLDAAPSPTEAAIEHVRNMDRPMEIHKVGCLERWVDVPGYGRMPVRLMDPFECICDIEDRYD